MTRPAKKVSGRGLAAHLHQVTVAHQNMHAAARARSDAVYERAAAERATMEPDTTEEAAQDGDNA